MKKKLTALLVMAIFLVSLMPIALAEEGSDDQDDNVEVKTRTKIELKSEDDGRVELKQETRTTGKVDVLKDVRVRLRNCKQDDSQDCRKVRDEAREKVKGGVSVSVDKMIAALTRVRANIENSEMPDKDARIAEIDARIATLTELKANLAGLETPQELRESIKELKEKWNEARKKAKEDSVKKGQHGLNGVLQRIAKLEEKLDKVIDRLEAKGVDITDVEASFDVFSQHIENAQAKADEAKPFLEVTSDDENFETSIKQGHQLLKEAREELRLAHEALKETLRKIKSVESGEVELEAGAEAAADTNSEAEDDDSDEDEDESETEDDEDDSDDEEDEAEDEDDEEGEQE